MNKEIIDKWQEVMDNMKKTFINELIENYSIIIDERFMDFKAGFTDSVIMGNYEIVKVNNIFNFYPDKHKNNYTSLGLPEVKLWNDKVKDKIKKIENLNNLIDKI